MIPVRLWTYQGIGFDLTKDERRPELSTNEKKFPDAYRKLHARLETEQYVWCCQTQQKWHGAHVEWELETAEHLAIVDEMVWNGIIGCRGVSTELRDQIYYEGMDRHPGDVEAIEVFIKEECDRMHHPPGDPWDSLLQNQIDVKSNVLIELPIDPATIVSKTERSDD